MRRRGSSLCATFWFLGLLPGLPTVAAPPKSDHWAFQPVSRPALPAVKNVDWCRNPIDRFVLAKLEERGWSPPPAVRPEALLRRLTFDLNGLPPSPEQRDAFLNDRSPEATERLVDDLLARPAYGERWARHWLDVVRFAESNGYERDAAKPSAWRYRDYVIRAFNQNLPFDRFLIEQLAGDELADADRETIIATTYYRLGPWDDEPADPKQDRFDQLDDIVSTTSEVFLGLTLACARCHDHKFEPLAMRDYYGLVAVFNGLIRPQKGRTGLEVPVGTRAELEAVAVGERAVAQLKQRASARGTAVTRIVARLLDGRFLPVIDDFKTLARTEPAQHVADFQKESRLRDLLARTPKAHVFIEPKAEPPETYLLLRGQAANPGPEVAPGVPVVLASSPLTFPAPGERTSLRRLTLAQWLARPEHPLTARVIVNRVWQHHFGEGLVRTPSDFGTMGDAPTHPELLDWLADWFVNHGWSIKALHRLILASNTYRMGSQSNPVYAADDPENRLLWHRPARRLDVEAIRDAMLVVSGQANKIMYGVSMYPTIPSQALEAHSDPDKVWRASEESESSRRTIYAFVKRSLPVPMLEVFDFCDTARSTAKRSMTSVAPQALTLFNGDFVNRQAHHFATRLECEVGTDPQRQVEHAILLALGRHSTETEKARLLRFLEDEATALAHQPEKTPRTRQREALEQMCRALFNLNEFVYFD